MRSRCVKPRPCAWWTASQISAITRALWEVERRTEASELEAFHELHDDLSPDGRMSWMAIERDVRSDEADPYRRLVEEQRYILAAGSSGHGIGLGLAALAPSRLETRILRSERPFVVVTEATFNSLALAIRRLMTELAVEGEVIVNHDGRVTTLTVRANAAAAVEKDGPETPVGDLFEELDRYRILLTDGKFIRATGFTLIDGDTVAVPVETPWETIVANGGILEVSLAWTRSLSTAFRNYGDVFSCLMRPAVPAPQPSQVW